MELKFLKIILSAFQPFFMTSSPPSVGTLFALNNTGFQSTWSSHLLQLFQVSIFWIINNVATGNFSTSYGWLFTTHDLNSLWLTFKVIFKMYFYTSNTCHSVITYLGKITSRLNMFAPFFTSSDMWLEDNKNKRWLSSLQGNVLLPKSNITQCK